MAREKKRNNTISIEEINWIELKMQEPISSDYFSKSIMAKELESQIFNAIEKLPEGCCEVFKLRRIEGMSHENIAKKVNNHAQRTWL